MLGIVGVVTSVDLGEHPGHVVGQGAHGLRVLGVERSLPKIAFQYINPKARYITYSFSD